MKRFLNFLLVSVIILSSSCQKEEFTKGLKSENITEIDRSEYCIIDSTLGLTIKIQDSTLYFLEPGDMLEAMQILRNMGTDQRRKWEKSVGFVSAQTRLENIKNEISLMDNEEQFNNLLSLNSDLIKYSKDDVYGIKSRIYGFYPYVASHRGFFVTQNHWGRVLDGKLYTCNFYDDKSYYEINDLTYTKSDPGSGVKSIIVDFNHEDDLKSYHVNETVSNTKIVISMKDISLDTPTKIARYTMEIVNSYDTHDSAHNYTMTQYYFEVYYNGTCCDPSMYCYYYAPYGGMQFFEPSGTRLWRIKVPYPDYFDSHPFIMTPNWDRDTYYPRTYTTTYYNFHGRSDLDCSMQVQKRNIWQNWVGYSGSVVYIKDVYAEFKVGKDVTNHSNSTNEEVGPLGDNYIEQDEGEVASTTGQISGYTLTEYTSKPPVVFDGCVSGELYARFCPIPTCNFSFNF